MGLRQLRPDRHFASGVTRLGSGAGLLRLMLAVAWRAHRLKRVEQAVGGSRNLLDRTIEGGLVALRGMGKAAELTHELQRRGAHLVLRRRRLEVEQRPDVAAHRLPPARMVREIYAPIWLFPGLQSRGGRRVSRA